MKRERRLKIEALASCRLREHSMGRFKQHNFFLNRHYAHCQKCNMQVEINRQPMPNQINIGGEAVALNCTEKK
jgi:3-deoxy-D-manno-octulosonic-acid transferase